MTIKRPQLKANSVPLAISHLYLRNLLLGTAMEEKFKNMMAVIGEVFLGAKNGIKIGALKQLDVICTTRR